MYCMGGFPVNSVGTSWALKTQMQKKIDAEEKKIQSREK